MQFRLGIIGAGVMSSAIVGQLVEKKLFTKDEITYFDINQPKSNLFLDFYKSKNVQELLDTSKYVLFAVKPQNYKDICINNKFSEKNVLLSIMAGVKIETILATINMNLPMVRIMPNTPCVVGKGMCGLCFHNLNETDKSEVQLFFEACGDVVTILEKDFDTITSISGSGPAYIYTFLDGMIKGGIDGGLDYETSKKLAISTMVGACELAKNSSEEMSSLISKVCSKGGTTIEAINTYTENQLTDIIVRGIVACRNRSEELGKQL